MSTVELESIQTRERTTCSMTGSPGGRALRFYMEAPPMAVRRLYVDPVSGSDARDGSTPSTAFRTLTHALATIPLARRASAADPVPAPANSHEINLLPGTYTIAEESAAVTPPGGEAYFSTANDSLYFNHRAGTADRPIVIQGALPGGGAPRGTARPTLGFRLNFGSVQHVYVKNVRVALPPAAPAHTGEDTVHFHTLLPEPLFAAPVPTHHVLLRNCEIFDGGRPGAPKCHEVLKVNQCQHVYVEDCQVHGAYDGDGSNAIDFVAVQYGHVVDCDVYDAPDNWCMYVKGGSAYLRIEGNRIHGALNGFAAGEGTTVAYLEKPWWHYEAYAIQFVNNLVYDTRTTAVRIQGGYDILVAFNTIHNAGTAGQVFALSLGERNCTTPMLCNDRIMEGAWATTSMGHVNIVPDRVVLVYNNVVLIDNGVSGFNIFDIAADVPVPGSPPSLRSTPRMPGDPPMLRADEGLEVRGNFLGVLGAGDYSRHSAFVSMPSGHATLFGDNFRSTNRSDGTLPQLVTAAADPAYLRPDGAASNVLAPVSVSSTVAPPPPPSTWLADLPAVAPDTRVAPWPQMHDVDLDLDGRCRNAAAPIAGARSTAATTAPPPAGALRIVEVSAPEINRVYSGTDTVVVDDMVDAIEGSGFLQSRRLPYGGAGAPGSLAEGQYGYQYRIDLRAVSSATGMPSIDEMSIDFGPISQLDYDGAGPAHVYVITRGGMGSVRPSSAEQSGGTITFRFATPVPAGTGGAEGTSSFFFGLTSARAPVDVRARLHSTDGRVYDVAARAPGAAPGGTGTGGAGTMRIDPGMLRRTGKVPPITHPAPARNPQQPPKGPNGPKGPGKRP